jgi:hypothetical protein
MAVLAARPTRWVSSTVESLRRKGWLERATWGKYLLVPPDQGPDAIGDSNLLFHGIQFSIPDEGYHETLDGVSWGVNPAYVHEWNTGGSEIKLQISRRETPTLPTVRLPQLDQSYFQYLPFAPATITCLALPEIIAEKIRAC